MAVTRVIEYSVTTIVDASLQLRINYRFDFRGTVLFLIAKANQKDTPVTARARSVSIRLVLDESPEEEEAE
jgi:hypothetical protein